MNGREPDSVERVLARVFPGVPFTHCKCYDWLTDPATGLRAGFHFYSERYKLAVMEITQNHLEYDTERYSTLEHFFQQQEKDEYRRRVCTERGITLLEIPPRVTEEEVESLLNNCLDQV